MAHVITCNSCGQKSSVSDEIYARRIAGKKVTLRCTQCREPIPVDGRKHDEPRPVLPATNAPASSREPAKASPPALDRIPANQEPAAPVPPPASTRQPPRPKATLLGLAGLPMTPPALPQAAPKSAPPLAPPTPSARDEAVTLVDEEALGMTPPVAASPVAPPISAAPPPPIELAAADLQATLSSVATRPPLLAPSSTAVPAPAEPLRELEVTPSAVTSPVEPPPPTSIGGVARDENPPRQGRRVARVARIAIPLVAAAALAVGVFVRRNSLVEVNAPSPAPKTLAAKLDAPPPSAPAVSAVEASSAAVDSAPPAVLPEPAQELAPPPVAAVEEKSASEPSSEDLEIPSYVNAPVVLHRTRLALRRAERCHPHGHAVGTAQVYVTFAPNGRVVDARLEGEPLASAPVARCLLDQARSISLPKFEGEPFTIRQTITLR